MSDQPKPAAALTAARIKRGAMAVGATLEIPAPPPPSPQPLLFQGERARFWRRAGLFGLVYVGALVVFASAFDVWSMLGF